MLFDEVAEDNTYGTASKVVKELDLVVDRLYSKTHKLAMS